MERSWKWRRWAVFSTLAVCDGILMYLTLFGPDTRLSQDIANGALLLLAAIVNGYVFGATWDDKIKGGERLQDRSPPEGGPRP